jgi:hypothetical protein
MYLCSCFNCSSSFGVRSDISLCLHAFETLLLSRLLGKDTKCGHCRRTRTRSLFGTTCRPPQGGVRLGCLRGPRRPLPSFTCFSFHTTWSRIKTTTRSYRSPTYRSSAPRALIQRFKGRHICRTYFTLVYAFLLPSSRKPAPRFIYSRGLLSIDVTVFLRCLFRGLVFTSWKCVCI